MNPAPPAACHTGSWQQQWSCGWHAPTTTAANAGYFAGHNVAPALAGLLIVVALILMVSRARSGKPAASGGKS